MPDIGLNSWPPRSSPCPMPRYVIAFTTERFPLARLCMVTFVSVPAISSISPSTPVVLHLVFGLEICRIRRILCARLSTPPHVPNGYCDHDRRGDPDAAGPDVQKDRGMNGNLANSPRGRQKQGSKLGQQVVRQLSQYAKRPAILSRTARRFQPSAHLGTWRQACTLENRLTPAQYDEIRNRLNSESSG